MAPWTSAWIRCPHVPYHPCNKGMHGTSPCNTSEHTLISLSLSLSISSVSLRVFTCVSSSLPRVSAQRVLVCLARFSHHSTRLPDGRTCTPSDLRLLFRADVSGPVYCGWLKEHYLSPLMLLHPQCQHRVPAVEGWHLSDSDCLRSLFLQIASTCSSCAPSLAVPSTAKACAANQLCWWWVSTSARACITAALHISHSCQFC